MQHNQEEALRRWLLGGQEQSKPEWVQVAERIMAKLDRLAAQYPAKR